MLKSSAEGVIEIDLIGIIRPIVTRWLYIVLAAALGAGAGFGRSMFDEKRYDASVSLAVVKTRTDVQFDPRIRTSQPDELAIQLAEYRRNALISLASSPNIAAKVFQALGNRFGANSTSEDLRSRVSVASEVRNDLITIVLWANDPQLAADAATLWAREYEKLANSVLSGMTPQYIAQVDAELSRAKVELEASQKLLLDYMRDSRPDDLRLTINQKVRELDRLEALRLAPVLGALQRSQSSLGAVASLGEAQERTRQLLTLAKAMRKQVELGGESAAASNVIPLINLKLQAFAIVSARSAPQAALDMTTSSVDRSRVNDQRAGVEQTALGTIYGTNLQLNVPSDVMVSASADMQLRDLDGLIATLSDLDSQFSKNIASAQFFIDSTEPPAPSNVADINAAIDRTTQELRIARMQLEDYTFRSSQLTSNRDVLRDTVQSLRAKRAEVDVSSGVSNSQIRMTGEAVGSLNPSDRTTRLILFYGGIGLALGLLLVIVLAVRAGEYRQRPEAAAR